ncbi:hypothetical protein BGZ80_004521 [Entomortierella chlamydospora]|uniref:Uncharacterized protein n=1 Tax=Entomortierella chlamydospora TaxID=101097 RepID=A0A9P6N3Z0_9FUNG|nr:hypothetical protein BGZ80_004521 [Entomortierella chlamydospora]
MYHEVALRMLRIHQIQSERIRDEQLEKLAQTIDQAQQQLSASQFETDPKPRRRGKYFHCPPRTKSTIARLAFKLINGGTVTSHQKAVRIVEGLVANNNRLEDFRTSKNV